MSDLSPRASAELFFRAGVEYQREQDALCAKCQHPRGRHLDGPDRTCPCTAFACPCTAFVTTPAGQPREGDEPVSDAQLHAACEVAHRWVEGMEYSPSPSDVQSLVEAVLAAALPIEEETDGVGLGCEQAREALARAFHEAYEELAPSFGYETRKASAKPWEQVPVENRHLMVAVVGKLVDDGVIVYVPDGLVGLLGRLEAFLLERCRESPEHAQLHRELKMALLPITPRGRGAEG